MNEGFGRVYWDCHDISPHMQAGQRFVLVFYLQSEGNWLPHKRLVLPFRLIDGEYTGGSLSVYQPFLDDASSEWFYGSAPDEYRFVVLISPGLSPHQDSPGLPFVPQDRLIVPFVLEQCRVLFF